MSNSGIALLMCLTNVPKDTIISFVDFSKNYTLMVQNEIENMH